MTAGTALVTGASSGIGLELARLFAHDGYDLILVARSVEKLDRLGAELSARHGIRARTVGADLGSPDAPGAIAETLKQAAVRIDVLVNNAGYGVHGPFAKTELQTELDLLRVNVVALTHLTKLLLPTMLARRAGRILNVASTAGFQPGPLMAVYSASKAYVLSFSEALAEELAGTGVTVTTLCPGPVLTGFQARAGLDGAGNRIPIRGARQAITSDWPVALHLPGQSRRASVLRATWLHRRRRKRRRAQRGAPA